jgi:hypothetical protein
MKIVIRYIFLIILPSCIDVIDFETDNQTLLTIYGRITNSNTHTPYVEINYTVQQDNEFFPEENATVDLVIDDESIVPFVHIGEGRYEPQGKLVGNSGSSYYIRVQIDDKSYISQPELMPSAIGRDSVSFVIGQFEQISNQGVIFQSPGIELFFQTTIPDKKVYLRWDLEEVYTYNEMFLPAFVFPFYSRRQCFVTKPLFTERVFLFENENNSSINIPIRSLLIRPIDESFEEIHYFGLVQNSLTQEAFKYWQNIDQVANRSGSIFEIPPAAARGNVFNEQKKDEIVLGFFEASLVDTSSVYVINDELSQYIVIEPLCTELPASSFRDIPFMCLDCVVEQLGVDETCVDCTKLANSSLERPAYFPDINY